MNTQRSRVLAELAIPAAASATLTERFVGSGASADLGDMLHLMSSTPEHELARSAAAYALVLADMRAQTPKAVAVALRLAEQFLADNESLAPLIEAPLAHLRAAMTCQDTAQTLAAIDAACAAAPDASAAFTIFTAISRQLTACNHPAFGLNPIASPSVVHAEIIQLAYAA